MRPVVPAPSTDRLAIGAKLRAARLTQGLTIAQVAEATSLNKGFISRMERDETSPSVTTLVAICEVLSIAVGSLFEPTQIEIVPFSDAPRINMGGTNLEEYLLSARREGRAQLLRTIAHPGANGGAELYTINCDVEILHVISGSVRVRLTREEYTLAEGDTMTLPGREPHTWSNPSDQRAELIWLIAPAAWSGAS